jgi:hypothetical protein
MHAQVTNSDYILLVATETYKRRAEDATPADEGRGVRWESMLITSQLYSSNLVSPKKVVPVLLGDEPASSVPYFVDQTTFYRVKDLSWPQLEPLYRRLTGQPKVRAAELGAVVQLGEQELPPVNPLSSIPEDLGPVAGPPQETEPRAGAPTSRWNVSGPWAAFLVGDGVRLFQATGHEIAGMDVGEQRPGSRAALAVPVTQMIAAENGTALVGLGVGGLVVATVDSAGDVVLRPDRPTPPEDGLTLLSARVYGDVIEVFASSDQRTVAFRIGTSGRAFGVRQAAGSPSRAALSLSEGLVRVDVAGNLVTAGDVLPAFARLPPHGWSSFDRAGDERVSLYAGLRSDDGRAWLHTLWVTDEGPSHTAVILDGSADCVQVARPTRGGRPGAVLVQQGDTVVGWSDTSW